MFLFPRAEAAVDRVVCPGLSGLSPFFYLFLFRKSRSQDTSARRWRFESGPTQRLLREKGVSLN